MSDFPPLDVEAMRQTRDALHAYARVLGDGLKAKRAKRKHWWHASLRPSLMGLTTGIVHDEVDYEIELNFRDSEISVRKANGEQLIESLHGQSADQVAAFLQAAGVHVADPAAGASGEFPGYAPAEARELWRALASVTDAMVTLRAGIREETSPIQLWPHHFDLSMVWLPGPKISGQDPDNEEYADKQMNFGFVFGDGGINEPYFYVTAYPVPDALPAVELPRGAVWQSDGFSGAVLLYKDLVEMDDPAVYLQDLWSRLYRAGRQYLATDG